MMGVGMKKELEKGENGGKKSGRVWLGITYT